MMRSAPMILADRIPSRPTAPSPTTATVPPGFTFAASAANQPVPITSETASRLGIRSSGGIPGVATRVPSASGTRSTGDEFPLLARALIAVVTMRTGVVGREERSDDELAGFDRPDRAADLLHDA